MAHLDCHRGHLPRPNRAYLPVASLTSLLKQAASPLSVPEMSDIRKGHRHLPLVGRGDHFGIAHRTTRLNGCDSSRFRRRYQTIRKRKKSITANYAAF